ncbi:pilus assembly protein CpaE [Agilicoccus flavus]|uniref:pilus assembly protein CpaE n=1 Tax=Agilicoccus flavus TaxID=2775968 RepID=UPI001CF6F7F3|nr:pilus assembly protein CpaE [Agilicoccus flavus]
MLPLELARDLSAAGMAWVPSAGDRFVIDAPDLTSDVFHLADMVADLHQFVDGPVVGFNGTTEWALDSVELDQVVWLPREDQLRDALGDAFVRLDRGADGYEVLVRVGASEQREGDADVETAYARALLAVLRA